MSTTITTETWEQALTTLRGQLDEDSFRTWLLPTQLHLADSKTLVLSVPSAIYQDWLARNYREKIVRALNALGYPEVTVDFCIRGGIENYESPTWMHTAPQAASAGAAATASAQAFDGTQLGSLTNRLGAAAPRPRRPDPEWTFETAGAAETAELLREVGQEVGGILPAAPSAGANSTPARGFDSMTMVQQTVEFPLNSTLNPKYKFDSFVVGESNRFAHAACRQVAEPGSRSYNPLFIYGGVGLGKTHLMQAIGHQMMVNDPNARVLYVSSETFMNTFIESISQGKRLEFRDFYRKVDLLMIDDVQFFAGKERTQTEFFHTFNALYEAGHKIVINSDRPPKELTTLEDRLRNRFSWGLVVDVQAPDLETRIAILRRKAEAEQVLLPADVCNYMAERVQANIRELEGVFVRLKAFASMSGAAITMDMAQRVLGKLIETEMVRNINPDEIIDIVCDYFDVKRPEIIGTSRMKRLSFPRHVAQYLCRKMTTLSFPEIALRFGGRDHTSVMHAFRKIEDECTRDETVRNVVTYLQKRIKGSQEFL